MQKTLRLLGIILSLLIIVTIPSMMKSIEGKKDVVILLGIFSAILLLVIVISKKKTSIKVNVTDEKDTEIMNSPEYINSVKELDSVTTVTETTPSFFDNILFFVYKTKDGGTFSKRQLLNNGYSEETIRTGTIEGYLMPITSDIIVNDPKMNLWFTLAESYEFQETYEEFRTKFSNIESVDVLYSGVKEDRLYTKSRNKFYKKYFPELIK